MIEYFLGVPVADWLAVKRLSDYEGLTIKEFAARHQAAYMARMAPGPIEYVAHRKQQPQIDALRSETEVLRARYSLLEERTASLERRLAKLRNV